MNKINLILDISTESTLFFYWNHFYWNHFYWNVKWLDEHSTSFNLLILLIILPSLFWLCSMIWEIKIVLYLVREDVTQFYYVSGYVQDEDDSEKCLFWWCTSWNNRLLSSLLVLVFLSKVIWISDYSRRLFFDKCTSCILTFLILESVLNSGFHSVYFLYIFFLYKMFL